MKKFLSKFNDMNRALILGAIIAVIIALIMLIPLFVANQPGWLIGVGIGSIIELVNIVLLYQGSKTVLKTFKPMMFLINYFFRMILFMAGFVLTAMLGFGLTGVMEPIAQFKYSLWGVLIAYTPTQFIIILAMIMNNKTPITITEKKEEKSND